jgi:hypothetical protein
MRPLLLAMSLLLSCVATAEEVYLPVGGGASAIELRITNPSNASTPVSIDLFGDGAPSTKQMTLAANETIELSDLAAGMGVLRIASPTALTVTAISRCASCGTATVLPQLAQPIEEGQLAAAVPTNALGWQSKVFMVNSDDVAATVTFAVPDGERRVRVGPRATRIARMPAGATSFRAPRGVFVFGYDVNARSGAGVFSVPRSEAGQKRRRAVRFPSSVVGPPPEPQTVLFTPSKDNTLFESSAGNISNGAGFHLFIGSTAGGATRRALIGFDLASQIPPGSSITRATLTMRMSQSVAGQHPATLHRVLADWGEGSSNAGSTRDGSGTAARTGDATWRHRFSSSTFWSNPGGDFDTTVDGLVVIGSLGTYTWESSASMVARIQEWLNQPATNFGWMIRGNEDASTTAKRLDSREEAAARRPVLTVEFVR